MARFVRTGRAIDYIPVADTPAGTIVKVGSIVGVVQHPIAAGVLGSLEICGVYELEKAAASAFDQGDAIYYNDSGQATGSAGNFFGYAAKASAATETTVDVILTQPGAPASGGSGAASSEEATSSSQG